MDALLVPGMDWPYALVAHCEDFMSDIVKYAISAYGFLLPFKEETSSLKFSQLIRAYSIHPKSIVVAKAVESSCCVFYHALKGVTHAHTS